MRRQNRKARRRKKAGVTPPRRRRGFHCHWCYPSNTFNERFVPEYFRAAEGHRRSQRMCWACHLEGAGQNGRRYGRHPGKVKPRLTAETLEEFWREDVSDDSYLQAAVSYFMVRPEAVQRVAAQIKV